MTNTIYWGPGVNIIPGEQNIPDSILATDDEVSQIIAALRQGKVVIKDGESFLIQDPVIVPPTIEEERANMSCTPAQMRLVLLNQGLLSVVQQIADSDPQASIVWEYAVNLYRNSPFINGLLDNEIQAFTPEQVDDLFRAAMGLNI